MTKLASEIDWYILVTHPRGETRVERGLEQRGITRFVPKYTKVVRQDRKRRFVERMLIPGYVLIAFERNRERWQAARETPGVIGLVEGLDWRPLRIQPATDVADLMSRCGFGRFDVDEDGREGRLPRIGAKIEFSTVKIGPLVSRVTERGRIVALEQNGMVRVLMHGARAPTFEKMRLDEFAICEHQ